jgi:hypothetical protein
VHVSMLLMSGRQNYAMPQDNAGGRMTCFTMATIRWKSIVQA